MWPDTEEDDIWDEEEDPDKWDESLLEGFQDDLPVIDYSTNARRPKKSPTNFQPVPQSIMQAAGSGIVETLARAIQHHEGWFPPGGNYPQGSASYRNNNPGNLRFIGQVGSIGKSAAGFAVFPNYESGWAALLDDLRFKLRRNPQLTIRKLLNVYAPPSENDTGAYIAAVADELNISPDVPLS